MKLGGIVVDIRSGKVKVESFGQLLSHLNDKNFPFNANHLDGWMKQKHKELCMMKRFQDEAQNKINNRDKVNFFPSTEKLQEQMTKFPVEFGFELTFTSLACEEIILEQLNQTLKNLFTSEISTTTNSNDDLWFEKNSDIARIQKEIVTFAELANNYSNDQKLAFAITAHEEYKEICASQFSIIFHNKQKRIFVPEPILNAFQNYPKEKFIDVFSLGCDYFHETKLIDFIRLIVQDQISEDWNHIPLASLCRFYKKENLIDIVRLLIDKNIDVNCKNNNGSNALTLLCQFYNKENLIDIVQLIIEKNIDVNWKDNGGWNALLTVCRYYDKENLTAIIRLLIEKNIDVHCKTNGGDNALTLLCQCYNKENLIDIVRLIIEKNIDVNWKDNGGWNALLTVCRYYDRENLIAIVRLLIDKNIDVNCKTNGGNNALTLLCQFNNKENLIEIVRLIIEKNIDVNCKTNGGDNALTFLCRYYDKENLIDIVRLLIDKNIDVNCKDNDGWNALHFVCRYQPQSRLVDLVRLLVQHKIDKKVKTTEGETARSLLLSRSYSDMFWSYWDSTVLGLLDS
jgi:ankyrin repeat protein